jgi:hypothetical protein
MPSNSESEPRQKGADWWQPEDTEGPYRFQPSIKLARLAIDVESLQEVLGRNWRLEIRCKAALYAGWMILMLGAGAAAALAAVTGQPLLSSPGGRVAVGVVVFGVVLVAGGWSGLTVIRHRSGRAFSRDRIEVTPEGLPSSSFEMRIASAQDSISERFGRVLAALAYRTMGKEASSLPFGKAGSFDSAVDQMLRRSLPVPAQHDKKFFSLLFREVMDAAKADLVKGSWGELQVEGDEVRLKVKELPARTGSSEETPAG